MSPVLVSIVTERRGGAYVPVWGWRELVWGTCPSQVAWPGVTWVTGTAGTVFQGL